jgi:indole-3-glycerol phosphate synthase
MKMGVDFLATVVESKRARLETAKSQVSFYNLRASAYEARTRYTRHAFRSVFEDDKRVNIIAEIKRASPSKGELGLNASVEDVCRAYSRGGAAALSVLTEEDHFHGSVRDLRAVRRSVALPILRKDFIFDEYQIYESADTGADALLLIAALLDDETLLRLRSIAEVELGMDALVEVHTPEEMRRAADLGARLIGVNNRSLRTFDVSIEASLELINEAPSGALLISESGLKNAAEIKRLHSAGYRGFLIGESLIRAGNPEEFLRSIIEEAEA